MLGELWRDVLFGEGAGAAMLKEHLASQRTPPRRIAKNMQTLKRTSVLDLLADDCDILGLLLTLRGDLPKSATDMLLGATVLPTVVGLVESKGSFLATPPRRRELWSATASSAARSRFGYPKRSPPSYRCGSCTTGDSARLLSVIGTDWIEKPDESGTRWSYGTGAGEAARAEVTGLRGGGEKSETGVGRAGGGPGLGGAVPAAGPGAGAGSGNGRGGGYCGWLCGWLCGCARGGGSWPRARKKEANSRLRNSWWSRCADMGTAALRGAAESSGGGGGGSGLGGNLSAPPLSSRVGGRQVGEDAAGGRRGIVQLGWRGGCGLRGRFFARNGGATAAARARAPRARRLRAAAGTEGAAHAAAAELCDRGPRARVRDGRAARGRVWALVQ